MTARKPKLTFDNDENVLCFHGPLLYEAKVIFQSNSNFFSISLLLTLSSTL